MTSKRRPSFFLVLVLAGAALSARPAQAASKGELSLRADPKYVSPNGDGFQDQAFLYPVVQADAPVTRWRLDIAELGGHRAARLTGATLPGLITWSALDKKGEAALDGAYNARLDVWGKGLHLSTQETFFIDTIPPDVGLVTSTNSIDASSSTGVDFITRADDASPIDRWQIQILDDTGRTVQLFWSTGPAQNVTWDGKERGTGVAVPPGRYHAAFQAWDAAGNESESVFVDLTASATARQEMER
ncbi:MAG: hypothetical protein JO102_05845 [Elusimicrobia bacterium]|nr:hypothetical protein [Elusimicrobiota bacterium]